MTDFPLAHPFPTLDDAGFPLAGLFSAVSSIHAGCCGIWGNRNSQTQHWRGLLRCCGVAVFFLPHARARIYACVRACVGACAPARTATPQHRNNPHGHWLMPVAHARDTATLVFSYKEKKSYEKERDDEARPGHGLGHGGARAGLTDAWHRAWSWAACPACGRPGRAATQGRTADQAADLGMSARVWKDPVSGRPPSPPMGPSGTWRQGGSSAPGFALVAGLPNWLIRSTKG
jgi:hypothetical protein